MSLELHAHGPEGNATPRVLYVVYWGAAEPLGRSLIVPSVARLAKRGARLTLVSFEKPADLARAEEIRAVRGELGRAGVDWRPLTYHRAPKWPATAYDMARGVARGLWVTAEKGIDVVHARTFIGGLVGFAITRLVRCGFVYHNEGFYPDEQVDSGVWVEGALPHRVARGLERMLYASADANIVLSRSGAREVDDMTEAGPGGQPSALVVGSCVDLAHFSVASRPAWSGGPMRLVYSGSIGTRYAFDEAARFVGHAVARGYDVELEVLTPAPASVVEPQLREAGVPPARAKVHRVSYGEMPSALRRNHAGLAFLKRGLAAHGSSPTKVGEYWACGLPTVASANGTDVDEAIRRLRVGVSLGDTSTAALDAAVEALVGLLRDPETSSRCRQAAEEYYDVERGARDQLELYRRLARPSR